MVRVYPNKPIHFYQFGYPSSPLIDSSLEKQRKFVVEAFRQWDKHHEQIELLTFTWLYDVQTTHIESMSESTLGDINPTLAFSAFLGLLGLIGSQEGQLKPAFTELQHQLSIRGWRVQR